MTLAELCSFVYVLQVDMLMTDVRIAWQAAAAAGAGESLPSLPDAIQEAMDSLDEDLTREPVQYDPDELAIRIAFNLTGG